MVESSIVPIDTAKQRIDNARTLDQVVKIRDKAAAIEAYYRRAGKADEKFQQVLEIKLRAERKAGEQIKAVPREPGRRSDGTSYHPGTRLNEIKEMYGNSSVARWQKLAAIPEARAGLLAG